MKALLAFTFSMCIIGTTFAEDEGTDVTLSGMTSTTPKDWKSEEPSNNMRLTQFALPKAKGDLEDAQLAVFAFPGGSGSLEDNLKRQEDKFLEKGRDAKTEEIMVGTIKGSYPKSQWHLQEEAIPYGDELHATSRHDTVVCCL